jgi:hypothetical protein
VFTYGTIAVLHGTHCTTLPSAEPRLMRLNGVEQFQANCPAARQRVDALDARRIAASKA